MRKPLRIFINKYLLTGLGFLILMGFFDQNDWFTQRQRQKKLDGLERNIQFLDEEIGLMETELHLLNTDPLKLETYAREKYFQKRDNEDVYLIKAEAAKE